MPDKNLSGFLSSFRKNLDSLQKPSKETSRKDQIRREPYDHYKKVFSDPDPRRSTLCPDCKAFMDTLHSHPWSDSSRAKSHFGQSHHGFLPESLPGWCRDLAPQSSCALCSMIWDILVANFAGDSKKPLTISHWRYCLRPTHFGDVYDSKPKESFGERVSISRTLCARWCLGIEIDDLSRKKNRYMLPNVIHGATRPLPRSYYKGYGEASFAQRPFLHGRARALEADIDLLKGWLRLCDRYHGNQCASKNVRQRVEIRLIDTEDLCITSHRQEERPYVALSYVWGGKEQLYAPTVETYSALAKKGSLRNLRLSKSISDAMILVQRLGLRYLWADALCIRQDDAEDKEKQISEMGVVYQNALFTIIAASGTDCDAGLPGIRPGTRSKEQQLVEAGDITLLSSLQYPSDKIMTVETSKWARRAWTFQEELLSPRQMIFTDEQIWWRCPSATWCEDSQLETEDPVGFLLTGQVSLPRLEKRYTILNPDEYFDLVTNYAQRDLTYPSDALNAFSGVLSMLTDYSNEQFLWGLMIFAFERQLYWVGKAARRDLTNATVVFPTWSWVAWTGEVSFRHYTTYNPLIVCFTIRMDGYGRPECVLVSDRLPRGPVENAKDVPLPPRPTETSTVSLSDIKTHYPVLPNIGNFHLFFYTYIASFYLMPQGRLILPDLPTRYSYSPKDGHLLGPKPDYGYLVPSLDGSELCEKGYRECILLGRRLPASEWGVPHVVLMLVKRGENGIAYRLGIVDMSEEFWDLAEKKWELIALG